MLDEYDVLYIYLPRYVKHIFIVDKTVNNLNRHQGV